MTGITTPQDITVNEDNFSAAFEQLSALGDNEPPAEGLTTPEADAIAAPAETPPAEGEPAAVVVEPPAETPPAEGEPAAVAVEPPAPAPDSTDRLASTLDRLASTLDKQAPPEAAPPAVEEPPLYTAEEQDFLKTYETDWPEVRKAEQMIRRQEYVSLVNYIFSEVSKQFSPLLENVQTLTQHTALTELQTKVADYSDVRDKVVDWAENQPDYLRSAYDNVIKHGTVDQVVDLIDRWRKETGTVISQNAAPATPPQKKDTELPQATKQAAAALAPVSSKRSTPVAQNNPDDFDGAFRSFAETVN